MLFVAVFCWYDCLEAITMEITTTMEASSLSNSSYHQATVNQIAWHKNVNQWGECRKRGGKWVWNESFHFALLVLLLSIHCKAVSHSEELSLVLIDRVSKKHFYQLLYQQGLLLKHGLESLSDIFHFGNLSLVLTWMGFYFLSLSWIVSWWYRDNVFVN